jgi:alpha-tubulin suppressor-like RCC1 family protein
VRTLTIVLAACLAACESPFVAPPPTTGTMQGGAATLTLRPDSLRLFVDDTFALIVTVRDSQGQVLVKPVTWTVDDSTVAQVSSDGVAIAMGSGFTVVRAMSGGVADSTLIRVAPIEYQSVTSGVAHSCAVGNNARVYCWGSDGQGQLGVVPPVLERTVATAIAGGGVFSAVAAGQGHTCGADRNLEMRCWGQNDQGQLGQGHTGGPGLPSAIISTFDYVSVVAGGGHTCALTQVGTAVCWGRNASGELGKGDTAAGLAPALAAGGRAFVQLVAGAAHTCGLTANGIAFCWGANALGQLGDSGLQRQTEPDSVRAPEFTGLAAGGNHTCGVDGGSAYCWGSNLRGESGSGLPDSALVVPAPVTGGLAFASLTAGSAFTCGLTPSGAAYCWGANDRGQLGDGTQTDHPAPTAVNGGLTFAALAAGSQHICGVTPDHVIYCWGDGTSGQLGLAVPEPLKTSPTRIPFPN